MVEKEPFSFVLTNCGCCWRYTIASPPCLVSYKTIYTIVPKYRGSTFVTQDPILIVRMTTFPDKEIMTKTSTHPPTPSKDFPTFQHTASFAMMNPHYIAFGNQFIIKYIFFDPSPEGLLASCGR